MSKPLFVKVECKKIVYFCTILEHITYRDCSCIVKALQLLLDIGQANTDIDPLHRGKFFNLVFSKAGC
jgi:hypothetical protein